MKSITVKIPENKYEFFVELLASLPFVELQKEGNRDTKEQIAENIRTGYKEAIQIDQGSKEATTIDDFLNEL